MAPTIADSMMPNPRTLEGRCTIDEAARAHELEVDAAPIGRAYGLARIGVGAGFLLVPRVGARLLGDQLAERTVRLLGVRDVLLGVDAFLAAPGSRAWRRAMALGAAADAADAVVTAGRLGHRALFPRIVLLSAVLSAATGAWLAAQGEPIWRTPR
jgi:hypothetical protein